MPMTAPQAARLLQITLPASDEAIRAAYTELVRRHPPDRDPDQFEKIRDAYDLLRDAEARARAVLDGPDPVAPLASVIEGWESPRQFVGSQPWLQVLKEKRP